MTATVTNSRIKELKGLLAEEGSKIERIQNSMKDETGRGHFVLSKEQHTDYLKSVDRAEQIQAMLITEEKAAGILSYLAEPTSTPVAGMLATNTARGLERKSLSQAFLESEAYQEMKARDFREPRGVVTIDQGLYSFEQKDLFTLSGGTHTTPAFGTVENVGISERQRRPNRVRDLFPAETTTSNIISGVRQTGFVNNAGMIPERRAADGVSAPTGGPTDTWGRAPRSSLQFEPYTRPISEIGHYETIHKNTLADESRLRGILERDLIDGVKLKEDEQILFGDGLGENLLGITQTPGIQLYTGLASDKKTAQIRRALTRAILSYYDPSGVVMHPLDFEDVELEEDKQGGYRVAVSVAIGAEKRVWRLNVIDTPAMVQGKYLLGAWGYGAKLFDRETVVVQASTEHGMNFIEGTVTIKASERIGLACDRPESFVYGSFTPYVAS
ncbi:MULTISPECIES: phage major capsid protein [Nonomuraea]|uniref:HK97 family phage major capsid protein n=1 Tax=Nonomuraea africana TaxID=46171 RepID=A0ABR9KX48_9ACTN|nr:phage major capsid protein [Nonomuraea africana]MBE1566597.1 HK97 family phage major capsid protein [Nonomuraea africana]